MSNDPGYKNSASRHAKKTAQWLGAVMSVSLLCLPLFSQTSQGVIQGGVFDQSGGAVAGAKVTVTDVARGVSRALVTDEAGQYVANNLTPSTYTVRAETKGFRPVEHSGVLVEVSQNIRVDLVVQPGEQSQAITVTGEIPDVNTTDSTLGGTVSNQAINDLPLNGRNFERLLELRPGNVSTPGAGTGVSSTNGARTANDILRLDGIAGIADSTGSSILNASYRGGDSSSLVPIDAIQEFNSEQNPKAEYGFRDGSAVNVGIKSGTNSLHGTAYAFGRDASITDASNFFTSQVTPANFEQFGATAGGRIIKDRLFWFASFEGVRDTTGQTGNVTVPISVAGGGVTSSWVDACNTLNPNHLANGVVGNPINPLSAQLAGLNTATCTITPASSTVENIFPYNTNASTSFFPAVTSNLPLNNGLFKADYVLGTHHHLNGMLFISKSQNTTAANTVVLPQYSVGAINNAQHYSGDWTWSPNSTWVNDFRLGYVFIRNLTLAADGSLIAGNPWPSGYAMPTGVTNPLFGGLPAITFTNPSFVLGSNTRTGRRGPQGDVDLIDSVSYLRGKHSFKFGFEYLDLVFDGDAYPNSSGTLTFSSLTTFLQGTPTTPASIFLGDATQNSRMHWFGGFIQDDWRIKPRVTLNLGLRYEYYTPPVERNNSLGNFNPDVNPATTPAIQQVGPGAPLSTEYNGHRGEVSPRLGVAWDVRGNGKTVVRAGASILTAGTIMSTLITTTPFGANFPSIGVNNSGKAINAVTPGRLALTAGQLKWDIAASLGAGTIFPALNPVTINGVTYTGVTCTFVGEAGLPVGYTPTPCQTAAVDPNFRQPSTVSWNLDVQRAITNKLTADIAYVGNHCHKQESIVDLNQAPLGTGYTSTVIAACINAPSAANCTPNAAAITAAQKYTSIFPYLSQIDESTTGDFSNYDALQATLRARGYHGLSLLAGYTFAHALSVADTNSTSTLNNIPTDKNNLRLGYGNSEYDLRHRFTFSPTYLIPGVKSPGQMLEGWSLNAIVTVQSGLPFTVADLATTDWLGTNEKANSNSIGNGVFQYWNYVGPRDAFSYNTVAPTKLTGAAATSNATCLVDALAPYGANAQLQGLARAALFNAGCLMSGSGVLTPPAYGTVGDAGHGFFLGPNYRNVDLSIAKLWRWKERFSAQFRVEFFNTFNRVDFNVPGTDPSKGSFGFATATPDTGNAVLGSGGPRHIQFGVKLTY